MGKPPKRIYNEKTYKCKQDAEGRNRSEHRQIVEEVLGRKLPSRVEVHHVDGGFLNNAKTNLVVCQDRAYHMLLHRRTRALDECGNANWRKCPFCKKYDDPVDMVSHGVNNMKVHASCRQAYYKVRDKQRWQEFKNGS